VRYVIVKRILFEIFIMITIQTMFYINHNYVEFYKKQTFAIMLFFLINFNNSSIDIDNRSDILENNSTLTFKVNIIQMLIILLNIAISNRLFYTKLGKFLTLKILKERENDISEENQCKPIYSLYLKNIQSLNKEDQLKESKRVFDMNTSLSICETVRSERK